MSTSPETEQVFVCAGCGASVYPEHLDRHLAGRWAGHLYCPCCLAEKKKVDAGLPLAGEPATAVPLEGAEEAAAPVESSGAEAPGFSVAEVMGTTW